jgi:hypothetical protein
VTAARHVVFDDSAMLAAGHGNIKASRLIRDAFHDRNCHVYAPTCALVEADRMRRGVAAHFVSLSAVKIVPLGLPAALALARETSWATAHVRFVTKPDDERDVVAAIATADPERWKGEPVQIIDLTV